LTLKDHYERWDIIEVDNCTTSIAHLAGLGRKLIRATGTDNTKYGNALCPISPVEFEFNFGFSKRQIVHNINH